MGVTERYLSRVGAETGDHMKSALWELLRGRYGNIRDAEYAEKLAASVVNYLFSESPDNPELQKFLVEEETLVRRTAQGLAHDESLCRALTCAVYNFSYGKYLDAGGKIGFLRTPFLGYVRALQRVAEGKEQISFLDSFIEEIGHAATPLLTLYALGLYRRLPYTPDSKEMMQEVVNFIRSART